MTGTEEKEPRPETKGREDSAHETRGLTFDALRIRAQQLSLREQLERQHFLLERLNAVSARLLQAIELGDVYEAALDDGADRLMLMEALRAATTDGSLMLHYQPQIEQRTPLDPEHNECKAAPQAQTVGNINSEGRKTERVKHGVWQQRITRCGK